MKPNNLSATNQDAKETPESSRIVGIDLGTTNSLIGIVEAGFPILLADADGSRLTPSAVVVPGSMEESYVVGREAYQQRHLHPQSFVTSVKRQIGVSHPVSGEKPLPAGHSAVEISAAILKKLKEQAEWQMGVKLSRAVITVPAYFNDSQRNATKSAAELAGWKVERILNEPTAAALAYGLHRAHTQEGQPLKIAVYDLGGGTFDLSILELRGEVFQVLSTHGDTHLGGDDFDRAIAHWILAESGIEEPVTQEIWTRVMEEALGAKLRLSDAEETEVRIPFLSETHHIQLTLTREKFEFLIQPILLRTKEHCMRAMMDAKVDAADLDHIILVGGSTRIPLVRKSVEQWFGKAPDLSQHPDEAVALGAVIQAGILEGSLKDVLLLDVTPLSLGIETFGGLMNVLIPRNTTIPCKAGEMFTNAVPGQESMLIRVLQGERELAKDNWELGSVSVPFTPGPKGSARVGVQFSIDVNGILNLLARDTKTGQDTTLEIKASMVDVDDEKIEKMIAESIEFAFEDMSERQWTEAKLKSEELLNSLGEALLLLGERLSAEEIEPLKQQAAVIEELLKSEEHEVAALKQANQKLDLETQELAMRVLELALEEKLNSRL